MTLNYLNFKPIFFSLFISVSLTFLYNVKQLKNYPSLPSIAFQNSVREGTCFYGSLISDITQLFKKQPVQLVHNVHVLKYHHKKYVCQYLKMKINVIENY